MLGGVLTDFISWHWVFLINVPFVLFVLFLARFVSESRSTHNERSYDVAGAVTVTAGLLLLVYAITQANQPGATLESTLSFFAVASLILALFVFIERRAKAPLIPLRIFKSSTTTAANLASLSLLGPFFSFLLIAALYLQDILRYSAINASLAILPGGATAVLVTQFIAPRLVNRLGMRLTAVLGLLIMALGIALFARIGLSDDYLGVILPPVILVIGLGLGIGYPALAIAAVSGIDNSEQGLIKPNKRMSS